MATNSTLLRQLDLMALTDLVLPREALDNIIENNELEDKLSGYATVDDVVLAAESTESKLSNYVPLSDYNSLLARIEALEEQAALTSSYVDDRDTLCGATLTLCINLQNATELLFAAFGGTSISVVDAYDASQALPGTIYFVKSGSDDTVSALHFISKVATVTEPASTVLLMAAMPERNAFAVAEDLLPAEEPAPKPKRKKSK